MHVGSAEDFWSSVGDALNPSNWGRRLHSTSMSDVCHAGCDIYFNNPLQQLKCQFTKFVNVEADWVINGLEDIFNQVFPGIEGGLQAMIAYILEVRCLLKILYILDVGYVHVFVVIKTAIQSYRNLIWSHRVMELLLYVVAVDNKKNENGGYVIINLHACIL